MVSTISVNGGIKSKKFRDKNQDQLKIHMFTLNYDFSIT